MATLISYDGEDKWLMNREKDNTPHIMNILQFRLMHSSKAHHVDVFKSALRRVYTNHDV